MKKKVSIFFLIVFFFLFQNKQIFAQIDNAIIISVGDYPITRLDLFNEVKLIAILSNTVINENNKQQIKSLAVKSLIKRNNLSFNKFVKRFEIDLKWNYMIFEIYKNKISLNTTEIENELQVRIENLENLNDEKINLIKEQIVNEEKEKKLKMFSNLHFTNIERSIQIKFL